MSKVIRVLDILEDGPEVYKVGWLASTGHVLLRDDQEPYLIVLADWLRGYGETGPSGLGNVLVPELSVWEPGDEQWEDGLLRLAAITHRFHEWTEDVGNTHYLALRDLLDFAVSVRRSPWIGQ